MKPGSTQAQNHPAKGSSIRVEPITSRNAISRIKRNLASHPRDLCLFSMGINTAYRASELLSLTVGQVAHLKPGDTLRVMQRKTGKVRATTINHSVYDALQRWLSVHPERLPNAPLFRSEQTGEALSVSVTSRMVKRWCRKAGLPGNYGSHSLRKTWGYHQLRSHKNSEQYLLIILMTAFGHATQQQTLDYLCIQSDEIRSLYLDLEL